MSRKHHVRFGGGPTEKYVRQRKQLAGGLPYQAAVHALLDAGFTPPADSMTWSHSTLQSLFAGELINRRKRYPGELRATLQTNYLARQQADYSDDLLSAVQAERALRRARTFVEAIQGGGASS